MKGFFYIVLLLMSPLLKAQQTEVLYLSGTDWDFCCTEGRNAGKQTTIPVPSCWELQGFGKYDYGFAKDSLRGKEQGIYKYAFDVPRHWKNKVVRIVFEGVMTDATVKVNGQLAGPTHQGAYYVFSYDITSLLKFDSRNQLEVTVAKHSANPSVNAAERKGDFWIFGGIFRPVYLQALPAQHISRVAVDARADGRLTADVYTNGNATTVTAQLMTLDNKKIGAPIKGAKRLTGLFSGIKQWTPESPVLYKVRFTLWSNGKPVHELETRTGFRTVEVRERDGLYVNGVKVKMKGVNRHSFWPTTGRTMSRVLSIQDVLLMKDMNMNAVRSSHYPPDGHFLDVCDSLGLFVMDELAGWHGHYDSTTGTKLVKEMIAHDVNHPSIIFWANGNEGGHNISLDPVFSQEDIQQRPVIHPWEAFGGFDTQHYREFNYGIGNYDHGHDIVMPTEFLHGMYDGGHGAGLEDYWEAMWRNPLSAGGFLWDFADAGVVRTDKDSIIDTDGNHGADGIVGPYREREGSYFSIKEIWSPVHIEHREITPAFDGTFTLENRYHYTNINQCRFEWKLEKWKGTSLQGTASAPAILPSAKGILKIDLPANWQSFDALHITVKDKRGTELVRKSYPITRPVQLKHRMVKEDANGEVKLKETDSTYIITVKDIRITLHRRTGILQEASNSSGIIPLNNGPILEEGINNFAGFSHGYKGKNLVIRSTFDQKKSYNQMEWTIYPSGWIRLEVNYFPGAYFTTLAGINFSFPEKDIQSVEYLGYGPYRVWKNRMKGNQLGIWTKKYNNTATGEPPFEYPEFKGYYAGMYWCRFITKDQSFKVVTESEDLFLRLFTPKVSDDPYKNVLPVFPGGDISFMQGISGIGTKTQKSETTGPMGQKHIYYDYEKDPKRYKTITLYFNFSGEE